MAKEVRYSCYYHEQITSDHSYYERLQFLAGKYERYIIVIQKYIRDGLLLLKEGEEVPVGIVAMLSGYEKRVRSSKNKKEGAQPGIEPGPPAPEAGILPLNYCALR